jgi:hypothetical protein
MWVPLDPVAGGSARPVASTDSFDEPGCLVVLQETFKL